jgi:hypothetical protein
VKRIASAVGEGALAVTQIHQYAANVEDLLRNDKDNRWAPHAVVIAVVVIVFFAVVAGSQHRQRYQRPDDSEQTDRPTPRLQRHEPSLRRHVRYVPIMPVANRPCTAITHAPMT